MFTVREGLMKWLRSHEEYLELTESALDEGDFDEAEKLVMKALKRWKTSTELWTLSGEIAYEQGDPERGVEHFREAIRCSEVNAFSWGGLAKCLLEVGEAKEALDAAIEATRLHPKDGDLIYTLAVALEITGQGEAAQLSYQEAHRLSPQVYFEPFRVTRDTFDSIAFGYFEALPDEVKSSLGRVHIEIYDSPLDVEVEEGESPLPPLLLGLFDGYSRADESLENPWSSAFPARVYLFQKNIERACPDLDELKRQINITLLHEVGHFLGLNEEELEKRGLD
jgi:predicted Zn-dependent protease with MMP-like domain